ncbi:transglycosylase domain-containing protein [Brachybacterium sp. J153]|uniref:transglycosylase domain-containing protein n=1 Tax=Brachybacterium sp. J153 TaxID=3116488 RepID=UPI002E75DB97|nr:transglycosylase domain-containing protein [Brachybacterium sp. J153]MEE1618533.1 transglycosylase domain-containing protein [Brachybacterium sp. J153]
MSDSRRSSRGSSDRARKQTGGARRAAGVRRSSSSSKPSGSSPSEEPRGTSRTGRRADGAAAAGAAAGAGATAKRSAAKGSGAKPATAKSGAAKSSSGGPAGGPSVSRRHARSADGGAKAGAAKAGAASSAAAGTAAKRSGGKPRKARATNFLNYPRAGAKNPWRWIPSFRMIAGFAALLVIAGVGFSVWLYNDTEVPEPSDFALAQTTRVYFADGETEMGQFSEINRTELSSDEIPQNVKDAVVASEDSSFYDNRGISPRGIARALINNLSGGARQGGSTITQQYVERYYTGTTTSYVGKVREMVMALKIDEELSKDEILSRYLNTIYFGRGAYGVEEASQAYFGKPAAEMTDAEAALLVAVIPAPSAYDPAENPEKATELWDRVITRQVNLGQMTPAEGDALQFPETIDPANENSLGGTNGYLLAQVRKELVAQGFTEDEINTGGFTIVSTIDPMIQQNTVQAIENLPDDRPENNHVGTVTIDPSTGAIRGMYGGADYVTQSRNDATQSRMQAGSIFKTFTLIAALEDGYPLDSRWDGNSPKSFDVPGGWTVKNFNDVDYGRVTLEKATTSSINTAYAEINLEIGPERTQETAITLGLPEDTPGLDPVPSNVLGSASPTVLEMGEVYATIASGGVHRSSYIVQSVTRPDGSSAYEHEVSETQALDEEVAINATVALQGPPTSGSARSLQDVMDGRPVAGKTGTSESFRSAWFVGFTPQLVTAVGMFQPSADGTSEEALTAFGGEDSITGGTFPTQVWGDIMSTSLEGQEELDFPDEVTLDNEKRSRSTQAPREPATQQPTEEPSEEPTTEEPTTEEPTTEEPTTEEPSEEPTTEEPTTEEPIEQTTEPGETQPTEGTDTQGQGQGGGRGNGNGNVTGRDDGETDAAGETAQTTTGGD